MFFFLGKWDEMVNKLLAIVVTYYPDRDLLIANTNEFLDYVDKVLVWENTPELEKRHYRFLSGVKFEYCGDGINSISHALNYAWKYAQREGYDYILLMDQDSLFDDFGRYLETVNNSEMPDGIWGPSVAVDDTRKPDIESVYSVINSGTFVKTEIISKIGGWNELFVIDGVDDEFCLRAKRRGINTYCANHCHLRQRYGTPQVVSFLGRKGILRNDSPERLYNIYRNFTIIARTYPESKKFRHEFFKHWIRGRIKWILFEKNSFHKLYSIFLGLYDGLTYKIKEK